MEVKEIHDGHFAVRLDFPSSAILTHLLNDQWSYVWGLKHVEVRSKWEAYEGELFGTPMKKSSSQVRNLAFEFLVSTTEFIEVVNSINRSVHIVQVNKIPPSYINFDRLKGRGKYELLNKQLDYLFEIEIPGARDYAYLVSSKRSIIDKAISWVKSNP